MNTTIGTFLGTIRDNTQPIKITVERTKEYFTRPSRTTPVATETLKALHGNSTLGYLVTSTNKTIPRHTNMSALFSVDSLNTESAKDDGIKRTGTGLMRIASELSFLKGHHGHVVLEADGSKRIHPAPFYEKLGFKPAFPLNNPLNKTAETALEAYKRFPEKGFGYAGSISMESREGLGKEALILRNEGIKAGKSSK
ncbi:MAG: hypothetical protein ACKO37_01870, partial [Vampirovibrionales bacterium]